MDIISLATWGFTGWTSPRTVVPASDRTYFEVHYDGGAPVGWRTGPAVPQTIDAEHKGQGWAGIGYSFVVDQAGACYEGRGWDYQGSFCPVHNRSAWAVQVHIGGDEQPSPAALATVRGLYDTVCARRGLTLTPIGHRDGYATSCPGEPLYAWIHAGMPTTSSPPPATTTPTGADDMRVITAPNRPPTLIGPGYVYLIPDAEQVEQLSNLHGAVAGNDRQYDIWRAGAEQGHLAIPASTTAGPAPAVDVDALAAALLRKVVTS